MISSTYPLAGVVLGICMGVAIALLVMFLVFRSDRAQVLGKKISLRGKRRDALEMTQDAARFKALVEGSSELITLIGEDGTFLYANPSISSILNYPPSYNIGKHVWHLIHPDDIEKAWKALTAAARSSGAGREVVELRVRHADGTWLWMEALGTNLLDDPAVKGIVVALRDIGERKRMEYRLQASAERALQILNVASDAIVVLNESGHIIFINESAGRIFGHAKEELTGHSFANLLSSSRGPRGGVDAHTQAIFSTKSEDVRIQLLQMRRSNGEEFTAELSRSVGHLGQRRVVVLVVRDVSSRMEIQRALLEAEQTLRYAFDVSPIASLIFDESGSVLDCNRSVQELLGYGEAEFEKRQLADLVEAVLENEFRIKLEKLFAQRSDAVVVELRLKTSDGEYIPARLRMARLDGVIGARGRGRQAICQIEDLRADVARRDVLEDAEGRFETAFEAAPVGMFVVDFVEKQAYVNAALRELLGEDDGRAANFFADELSAPEELDRRALATLIGAASTERFEADLARMCKGEIDEFRFEESLVHSSGNEIPAGISISLVRNEIGKPCYLIGQVEDLTEQKLKESKLARAATHDALTGLANRSLFVERLNQALARAERHGSVAAILFCDIDNLKRVNDQFGHAVGDEFLSAAAVEISRSVRTEDLVARFGGDEFVVLCEDVKGQSEAVEVAERVRVAISRGFDLSVGHVENSITIGVAVLGKHERPGHAVRRADLAMYRGKKAGGNRVEVAPLTDTLATAAVDEAEYGSHPGVKRGTEFEEFVDGADVEVRLEQ